MEDAEGEAAEQSREGCSKCEILAMTVVVVCTTTRTAACTTLSVLHASTLTVVRTTTCTATSADEPKPSRVSLLLACSQGTDVNTARARHLSTHPVRTHNGWVCRAVGV